MRITLLLPATVFALCVQACSEDRAAEDVAVDANAPAVVGSNEASAAASAPAPAKMPTDAAGFVQALAASDLYEIQSSALARQKAASADVRSFAQRLEREHGNSTAELKSVAAANGIAMPPPGLNADQQAMMEELRSASGAAFDSTYIRQQRTAHQMALMMIQNYRAGGDNEALKALAAKLQPMIETHLDLLNYMKV